MSQTVSRFSCPSCGKQYVWKPELAGKKSRCKCGSALAIPAKAPGAAKPVAPKVESEGLELVDDAVPVAKVAKPAAAGNANACPLCGGALTPGAVLCVQCGFNLKTGQKLSTAAAAPVAAAPPPLPGRAAPTIAGIPGARRFDAAQEAETPSGLKKAMFIVGLVVLVIIAIGAALILSNKGAKKVAAKNLKGDDARVLELMDDRDGTEANEWLAASEKRMVLGLPRHTAKAKVDGWYTQGAKKVYAFGGAVTDHFAIELPDDPGQRQWFFDWYNRNYNPPGDPPITDDGRQYLLIRLSP